MNRNYGEKICLDCGKKFKATTSRQKYCGSKREKRGCSYKNRNRYQKKYCRRIEVKYVLYQRANERKKTYKWDLTFEQFKSFWQKPCYYCGAEIETIGLDRIDSSKGYSLDNVVSCCWWCNRMKNNYSIKEFIEHCEKIVNFQKSQR